MTEHKALSAFEQDKLQEEVAELMQRVARLTEALATTNELLHNLAVLAAQTTINQEEEGE